MYALPASAEAILHQLHIASSFLAKEVRYGGCVFSMDADAGFERSDLQVMSLAGTTGLPQSAKVFT